MLNLSTLLDLEEYNKTGLHKKASGEERKVIEKEVCYKEYLKLRGFASNL